MDERKGDWKTDLRLRASCFVAIHARRRHDAHIGLCNDLNAHMPARQKMDDGWDGFQKVQAPDFLIGNPQSWQRYGLHAEARAHSPWASRAARTKNTSRFDGRGAPDTHDYKKPIRAKPRPPHTLIAQQPHRASYHSTPLPF